MTPPKSAVPLHINKKTPVTTRKRPARAAPSLSSSDDDDDEKEENQSQEMEVDDDDKDDGYTLSSSSPTSPSSEDDDEDSDVSWDSDVKVVETPSKQGGRGKSSSSATATTTSSTNTTNKVVVGFASLGKGRDMRQVIHDIQDPTKYPQKVKFDAMTTDPVEGFGFGTMINASSLTAWNKATIDVDEVIKVHTFEEISQTSEEYGRHAMVYVVKAEPSKSITTKHGPTIRQEVSSLIETKTGEFMSQSIVLWGKGTNEELAPGDVLFMIDAKTMKNGEAMSLVNTITGGVVRNAPTNQVQNFKTKVENYFKTMSEKTQVPAKYSKYFVTET